MYCLGLYLIKNVCNEIAASQSPSGKQQLIPGLRPAEINIRWGVVKKKKGGRALKMTMKIEFGHAEVNMIIISGGFRGGVPQACDRQCFLGITVLYENVL